jgi:hypothetical protein
MSDFIATFSFSATEGVCGTQTLPQSTLCEFLENDSGWRILLIACSSGEPRKNSTFWWILVLPSWQDV